ncbi:MAG: hypothetical protein Q9217_000719 [Psora testacea]
MDKQQNYHHYGSGMNDGHQTSYLPSSAIQSHVLQHHLYAPLDSYADIAKPRQRTARDVFIPEDLRIKLQKKTEATIRSFPNSQLPNIEYFHTLTPLEALNHRNHVPTAITSTVYKAISEQDGKIYCLRRIHDCRILKDSEAAQAITSFKTKWQRILNSNVVTPHMAFSTQLFGDTSVILVSDFYPDSTTLRERHFQSSMRPPNRNYIVQLPEQLLWSYMVQTANALKAIHSMGLAARSMDAKRWLVTDEDRIRFHACGMADILDPTSMPMHELQRSDLHQLGKLIFSLGTANAHNKMRPTDHFAKSYTARLRQAVEWLQHQTVSVESTGTIDDFLRIIASDAIEAFDTSLRLDDILQHNLSRELENSRLVRLLFKLNAINDRPEYETDSQWRDQGQRSALKLFRDYVFHQVDPNGNPIIDMGHMLACLNKLDVGVEEKVTLTSRDNRTIIVVSYREIKGAVEGAWGDLMRRTTG